MNRIHSRLTAVALAATLTVVVAACSNGTDAADSPTSQQSATNATTEHNDADVQFAQLMIAHHQGAIAMAELVAAQGSDPKVIALADRIKTAQGPEIDLMTGWLDSWGEKATHDMGMGGMDMGGMDMDGMSQADVMGELGGLQGKDFDQKFLTHMVAHHQGAITMAEQEKSDGVSPEAKALASKIIDAQTAEIAEMKAMLSGS